MKEEHQFGFTGTPIFPENSLYGETTAGIFGAQLHSYVITDAIRDAIKTFGDANSIKIILERSYKDYIDGFKDEKKGV